MRGGGCLACVDRGKRRDNGPLQIMGLRGSWNQKREVFEAIGEKSRLAAPRAGYDFLPTDCRLPCLADRSVGLRGVPRNVNR